MDVYYYELGDWEFNLKIKFMGTFRLWLNAIGRIIRYIAGGLWMFIKGVWYVLITLAVWLMFEMVIRIFIVTGAIDVWPYGSIFGVVGVLPELIEGFM